MSKERSGLSRLVRSPSFKLFLIGGIVLLLFIPLLMTWALVGERESRAQQVQAEVARAWGTAQDMQGPFLLVPFTQRVVSRRDGQEVEHEVERLAVFLPDALKISGAAKSRELKRSIYRVAVYAADLDISGDFGRPDVKTLAGNVVRVHWEKAVLALGLTNVTGLKQVTLRLNDADAIGFMPSLGMEGMAGNGIHAPVGPRAQQGFSYAIRLQFSGSRRLTFVPVGRNTQASLRADWPHPGFIGNFLPEQREVRAEGFSASWRIPHLARSVPQAWVVDALPQRAGPVIVPDKGLARPIMLPSGGALLDRFGPNTFGVRFVVPVDHYDLVSRALKYALMFLTTVFAAIFVMEQLSGTQVHAVQYLFVGLMLVLFYVLLLALAEHIGFTAAYAVAAMATGGTLALYVGRLLHSARQGVVLLLVFAVLYGLLYTILRMEDYALLTGALLAFAGLTAVMFLTLKVDWAGRGQEREST